MANITILPKGKTQFFDAVGDPLALGSVEFFAVGTSIHKDTWQDPGQSILNINPVPLDAAGEALIYGYGAYRQVVRDSVGNLVWDQPTQDVAELVQDGGLIWAGTSVGSPNEYDLTLTPPITAYGAGQFFYFVAHQINTGPVTMTVSGLSVVNLLKPSGAGPVPLVGSEISTNNIVLVAFDGSQFQLLTVIGGSAAGSASGFPWAIAAGTADAITATYSPANTTLSDGLGLAFRAAHANATTTPTFSPDGFTPHVITKKGGVALAPGDIPGALAECLVRYNLANSRWELLNPAIATSAAGSGGLAGIYNLTVGNKTGSETTQVSLVGTNVTLADGSGNFSVISAFNVVLDNTVSGAGGLDTGSVAASTAYYIYIIYNGTTVSALMSLSATTPTLPSGYTFFTRVSYQVTDGSKHFLRIRQLKDSAQYIVTAASNTAALPPILTGVSGSPTAPTWTAAPLAGLVPTTAQRIRVVLRGGNVNSQTIAAPNNAYGGVGSASNPPPLALGANFNTVSANLEGDWLLESTSVYYASDSANAGLFCLGWKDTLTC